MREVKKFFMRNLFVCSHKLVGIIDEFDEILLDTIPIILGGELNIDLTLRRLMSYIYGAPILDVSRSHTTTQHSR